MCANIQKPSNNKVYLKYISFGTELLILLGIGVWAGLSLDSKWNVLPLFTILFPTLAMIYSFRKLFLMLNQDQKNK